MFSRVQRLGRGRYGSVHACTLPFSDEQFAVKMVDLPENSLDQCVLYDVYTEIAIMEKFKYQNNVSHLYDYGVTSGTTKRA